MKHRRRWLLVTALLLSLGGCRRQEGESASDASSRKVIVYSTFKEEQIGINLERFEQQTGIQGGSIRLPAGDAFERIEAEKEQPRADIIYGGSIDMYLQAMGDGLLEPYVSPNAGSIADIYKDEDGYYTGVYISYLVIVYNRKLLEEKGVQAPSGWKDLLNPELEGQVAVAHPASSGTAYTFLSTMCQLYGEDEGLRYMQQLDRNVTGYQKAGATPCRMVAQGEAVVGVTFLHDALYYGDQGFEDLEAVIPTEGAGYDIGCIGIVKGGPNPESAREFLDFALTPDAVKAQELAGYYVGYTSGEVTVPDELRQFGEIKTIYNDFHWAGMNHERLVEAWSTMVQNER